MKQPKGDTLQDDLDRQLYRACDEGNLFAVDECLRAKANPNAVNDFEPGGFFPLYVATYNNSFDIVKLLVEHNADVNQANTSRQTALGAAIVRRNNAIAAYLLVKGANPNLEDAKHVTPLMIAVEHGNLEAARLLVENQAIVDWAAPTGYTALMAAVDSNQPESLAFLLREGASLGGIRWNGVTPLYRAAQIGHAGMVKQLLEKKANLAVADAERRWTPLHVAVACENVEVVELLLEAGADAKALDAKGQTPAQVADSQNQAVQLLRLIEKKDIKAIVRSDNAVALRLCTGKDIASGGMAIFIRCRSGVLQHTTQSLLMYAINKRAARCVQMLIEHFHLDANEVDPTTGLRALQLAVRVGVPEIVRVLASAGGATGQQPPIHYVVNEKETPEMVLALFAGNATQGLDQPDH